MPTRARCSRYTIAAATLALTLIGCGDEAAFESGDQAPLLSLIQTGTDTVDLQIAGPEGLRALQARLSYDPAKLQLTKVAAGQDASRLDRVFHGDLKTAAGDVVVGLTDTRRVLLPARGALLRLTVARVGGAAGAATLRITAPLGAGEGGARISMQGASLEVKLP